MNSGQRTLAMQNLLHTSVQDCESSIQHHNDPTLLMDLLIECHARGQLTREQVVRRRIAKLIKAWR